MENVKGYCPMGCGWTLILDVSGAVACCASTCPRPTAADELLQDSETEHEVQFGPATFTVRHPLRERLDDALWDCRLHEYVAGLTKPPVPLGRYRATWEDDEWQWEGLE